MKTHKILPAVMAVAALFILMSMTSPYHTNGWDVPAKYKTMQNPKAGKGDPDEIGKDLYETHCASCHGDEGYGDGKKSGNLETPMRDFTSDDVQGQKDGELYYKSFIGRDEMPNFEKKIQNENDRWYLINYLRELAK